MHNSVPVRIVQSRQNPGSYFQGPFRQKAAATGHYLPQGHTVDIFHNDVRNNNYRFTGVAFRGKGVLAGVVDRDNIWVIEGSGALCFPAEPSLKSGVFG